MGGTLDGPATEPRLDAAQERYSRISLLGRGGMGEVELCLDRRIGREVAMKLIRGERETDAARLRFLREARVQAQLEHPAVVPVYDLSEREDGQTYFTMKRVRGESLESILDRLRLGEAVDGINRRRLLSAFSQVCLAIDFAHERGVLHRDLKPSNIMLGDYGEVYVLDWGLAKIDETPELELGSASDRSGSGTGVGDVIGTLGYLAAEQLAGRAEPRSDVYALGAILFEVLTLEPLHEGETPQELLLSTMAGADARPSVRGAMQDVPPELEAICVRATAAEPADRYASARELHEAIERYLDGDRDLELRRRRASEHARRAEDLAERALQGDAQARAEAMREVGRTLGLEPNHGGALQVLADLLQAPPIDLPADAAAAVAHEHLEQRRLSARNGAMGFFTWLFYVPLLVAMGVREIVPLVITSVLMLLAAGLSLAASRASAWIHALDTAVIFVGTVGLASLYPFVGPYMLLPTIVMGQVVASSLSPDPRIRRLSVMVGSLGLAIPALLEMSGLIPPMTHFAGDHILIEPGITFFPPRLTAVVLLAAGIGVIATSSLLIGRARDAWTAAERRIQLQAWHFRQMVSAGAAPSDASEPC